jgi:A/G-specific adenine glycosylase
VTTAPPSGAAADTAFGSPHQAPLAEAQNDHAVDHRNGQNDRDRGIEGHEESIAPRPGGVHSDGPKAAAAFPQRRRRDVGLTGVDGILLAWFREHGRDLPWRRTRDPYAILVSEVMLQQTQVERVVPRYVAWLERWPTLAALAAASAADVIRAWQGLGYNRRGLNLHRAARIVALDGWPDDLTALPGVGRYTADAVRAFAFGEPVLPEDVNVRRVIERTGQRFGPECGQALMDLGATVCLARVPRCGSCPLAEACPARGRRYEPLRKQSRFEGSFRQRRALALRAVAAGEQPDDSDAVASLARDGLVELRGGLVALPE